MQKQQLHVRIAPPPVAAAGAGAGTGAGTRSRDERLLMHLRKLINEPPRTTAQMIEMAQALTRDIPQLHKMVDAMCAEDRREMVEATAQVLWRAIQMIARMSSHNVGEMWTPVPMKNEPAWTLLMCVFVNNAGLVTVWRSCCDYLQAALPPQWDGSHAATDDQYLLMKGVCVSDMPIEKYSTTTTLDAIALLATYWHKLDPCDRLMGYVTRLYHRACLIVAQPGTERVHDDEDYRARVNALEAQVPVYRANSRLVRTLGGQITRIFGIVQFILERDSTWARTLLGSRSRSRGGIKSAEFVKQYREFMCGRAALVANLGDGRAFVSKHFYRLIVTFGDIEEFMEQRDMEVPDPQSVMMVTKSPEAQQAWSRLSQTILLDKIPGVMHEEDVDYFDRFAFAQHVFCLIMKLYIFDLSLKHFGFSVRDRHLIWEIDLPASIPLILMESGPFFVQMFGMINVVYHGKIYRCTCTEEAIAMWAYIVLHLYNGRIDHCDIHEPLRELLYGDAAEIARARAEEATKVMPGSIDA